MTFPFLLYKLPSNPRSESSFFSFYNFLSLSLYPHQVFITLSCESPAPHLRLSIIAPTLHASTQRQRQIRKPEIRDIFKDRHYQRYVRGYIDYSKSSHPYTRNPERLKCGRCTSKKHNCKVVSSLIIKETRANRSIGF